MSKVYPMVRALNAKAWAIGQQTASGFSARRIVWGRLMASAERREGEELRPALIMVRKVWRKRKPT